MKYTYYLLLIFSLFISCDVLEKDIDTDLTKEDIFSDERFAPGFLNSSYRELINGFNRLDKAMFACASDEALCSYSGSAVHAFNDGAITPSYNPEDSVWVHMYMGIRRANMFLGELDKTIKEAGLIDKSEITKATYKRLKGEAYFLRGMYHFELVKRYSNIQLIDTVLTEQEAMDIPQSTYKEAIAFILTDCDSAAANLSNFNVDAADYGRATRLSALALKSRALLYLASPLNNPGQNRQWWKDAADAAQAIMDIQAQNSAKLNLVGAYHSVFTVPYNAEILFATSAENSNEIELYNNPISYGGKGYTNPTQELVDSYEMAATGKFINESGSGYDPQKPYTGRDRRLEYSVGYNGLKFNGIAIETYVGGKDGLNKTSTATKTGYYMRKYIDQNLNLAKNEKRRRPWIVFRYAETLLNYAEAMNEYLDVPDKSVYDAVNAVRKRAGIKQLTVNSLNKDEMRIRIRNERRVELAFEEHRFWDVRRWNEGSLYFNQPVHGMKITKDDQDNLNYEVITVENRVFDPKMNYYPIPQSELLKNKKLQQNTGW